MNILVLGGGGREHALAWNMKERGAGKHRLFIAPGNPGTAQCGENVDIAITDFERLGNFCLDNKIEMVIAGPEEPLVKGAWDYFQKDELRSIHFIGPSQFGAQLEGSKAFAKAFMNRHQIPTAAYREFSAEQFEEGVNYLKAHSLPVVLKADGLAAGKGVVICETHADAIIEFEAMLVQAKFGDASKKVVVEQFLDGIELSVFILTDGKDYVLLPEAKDYKRIGEKDTGLNTGGMGAVSPVPFANDDFMQKVTERIIKPTVAGLAKEQINYTGFVFIGLIKVNNEPYVIEYNCRMGDPETEVVMPRLKNDLAELCLAAAEHRLRNIHIETDQRAAATVVAVSGGYPGAFEKGYKITGLDGAGERSIIFQAGTKQQEGEVVTNGGRVLCATSFASNIPEAVAASKEALSRIKFDEMYFRKDIGYEFAD
ncbi:phosphoribosylamine--glycine ligase [Niabella insulamsoli]|uniref:phosphoribosylamine--glycine ligase n=1 Tax=Niabella insulamsoli TaxID=3144874 RepID=UPI0031FCD031